MWIRWSRMHTLAGPIVEPLRRREFDAVRIGRIWKRGWRDQQIMPHQKFVINFAIHRMLVPCSFRILEEEWAHHRDPGPRCFFGQSVEIGHQPIARLNKASANSFLLWPSNPWLLISGALFRMVAIDR